MAFKQLAVTLTGSAQRVSDSLTPPGVSTSVDVPCREIIFSADPANANVVYVGDANVASGAHAFALDPTQATAQDKVKFGPYDAGPLRLSDFYVLGTASQKVMIGYVPF